MSKANPRVMVLLSCGHEAYWHQDAVRNDARTCMVCREISTADRMWTHEYRVRCLFCHWSRFTGQNEQEGLRLGRHHGHETVVDYVACDAAFRVDLASLPGSSDATLFDVPADDPPPF